MVDERLEELRGAVEAGDVDAAILIARSAFVRARREDDLQSMVLFAGALEALTAEVLAPGERLTPWEDVRVAGRRLGSPTVELIASLQLAMLYLVAGNADVAARHVEMTFDLMPDLPADPLHVLLNGPETDQKLLDVLHELYYRHENFEATARIGAKLTERVPDHPIAWFYYAHSLNRLERFEEGIVALARLVELTPDQPGPRISLSSALAAVGRLAEAIVAADEAIRIKPEDDQYWFARGQIHHRAGHTDAALADFAHVVAEAERRARTEGLADSGRSRVQYLRDIPATDLADYARSACVGVLMDAERWPEAANEAWHMARDGDPPTASAGFLFLGRIASGRDTTRTP